MTGAAPRTGLLSSFERRHGVRLFLLALALRLVYLAETFGTAVQDALLIDSATYDRFARLILDGGFVGENVYAMNVLYPYVLAVIYAATGGSVTAALYAQSFAGALNVVLIAMIGHAVSGRKAGLLSGGVAAVYGPYIFYSGALLTPTLIDTFGLAMLVLLLRHRESGSRAALVFAGGALALMALGRGNAILFLPLALLVLRRWCGAWRPALARFAAFAVLPILLMGGVTLRNAALAGEPVPVSANVAAFYIGHNPEATGLYVLPPFTRGAAFEDEVEGTRAELSRRLGRELTVAESSGHLVGEGLRWARENPGAELRLLGRKFLYFWNRTESPTNLSYYFARDFSLLLRSSPLHFGILVPLAFAGLVLSRGEARERTLLCLYGSVFLVTGLAFFVAAEYRNPITAVLIVFASAAIVRLAEAVQTLLMGASGERRRAWSSIGLAALVAAPIAYACNVQTPLLARQALKRVDYLNAGTVLASLGEHGEARAMFERSIEIDETFGPAYAGLARVEHALGNELEAVRLQAIAARSPAGGQYRDGGATDAADALIFRTAEQYANQRYDLALDGFEALRRLHTAAGRRGDALRMANNVGLCLYKLARHEEAAAAFHDVLSLDSTYVFAYTNLARVEAARGNWARGDSLFRRAIELAPGDPRVARGWERFESRSLAEE